MAEIYDLLGFFIDVWVKLDLHGTRPVNIDTPSRSYHGVSTCTYLVDRRLNLRDFENSSKIFDTMIRDSDALSKARSLQLLELLPGFFLRWRTFGKELLWSMKEVQIDM
jgi:hypothetical protein